MAATQEALSREGHFKIQKQEVELCVRGTWHKFVRSGTQHLPLGPVPIGKKPEPVCAWCCLKPASDFQIISQWRHSWNIDSASSIVLDGMSAVSNWILSLTLSLAAFCRQGKIKAQRGWMICPESHDQQGVRRTEHKCLPMKPEILFLSVPSPLCPHTHLRLTLWPDTFTLNDSLESQDQRSTYSKNLLPLKSF